MELDQLLEEADPTLGVVFEVPAVETIIGRQASSSHPPTILRSRSLRVAWAWLGVVVVLVVALIVGVRVASTPKPTVNTPASVPASWQKVTFGGLSMYAPGNWPVHAEQSWGECSETLQPLFVTNSVVLDKGINAETYHGCTPLSSNSGPNAFGLVVDSGPYNPLDDVTSFGKCMHINGLSACPALPRDSSPLILAVHIPGRTQAVAVEIGLGGGGKVAHTILYSMRASESTASVNKPKVTPPAPWSSSLVIKTSNQNENEIAQASDGVDVLSGYGSGSPVPFTVLHYDQSTKKVTRGPSFTGLPGGLVIAGGWLWVALGNGNDVALYQLDPSTLSLHAHFSLPVKNLAPVGEAVNPTLASTVNGPLWVTGGEDFWGVNPSTGKVQTEFNSGNVISGLSTDPSGTYLYGGGETPHGLAVVVEYNAVTGTKLFDVPVQDAIEGASVSATNGGVWISYRGGMAGTAAELSQSGLRAIASPTAVKGTEPFGAGPAMGGISSSVNDGVLWFGSQAGLACADPRTGVVRAYEHEAGNPGPGSSFVLYGSGTGGIVAITPPAACFG